MHSDKPVSRYFPKVPIERRAAAFLIDFVAVWLVSGFFGIGIIRWLVFLFAWLALRVIWVERNHGQSLGRWALDMKMIDARDKKIPDLVTLAKREGIIGFAALLAMIGLNINLSNAISMILLISPLVADCSIALADEEYQQAFHDRIAGTVVIQSRRGFSLDLRAKKVLAQLRDRVRK